MRNCASQGTKAGSAVITSDGVGIAGWYIPAANGVGPTGPTIVLVHGWSANKTDMLRYGRALHATYNLVSFDQRDTGRSTVTQTTMGYLEWRDVEAIVDWLTRTKAPVGIGVLANSMGSPAALGAATRDPRIGAVLLDSAHAHLLSVVARRLAVHEGQPAYPGAWAVVAATNLRIGADVTVVYPANLIPGLGDRPLLLTHRSADRDDLPLESVEVNRAVALAAGIDVLVRYCDGADHGRVVDVCPERFGAESTAFFDRAFATSEGAVMTSFRPSIVAVISATAIVLSACGTRTTPTASPPSPLASPVAFASAPSSGAAASVALPSSTPNPGTWTATGGLITARSGHSATRLLDGRVLVSGQGPSELYDPATGTWSPTGGAGPSPDGAATLLLDGTVLVGSSAYDPTTGHWAETGAMVTDAGSAAAVLLADGRVLVPGGFGAEGFIYATAEIYDPRIRTWGATGQMSMSRGYETATGLLDGRVLVAGGLSLTTLANGDSDTRAVATSELFDPSSGKWTATGSMHAPRIQHTATLLTDGRVLVAGGEPSDGSGVTVGTAEIYDPSAGSWTTTGVMSTVRLNPKAVLLSDGRVLVIGGSGALDPLGNPVLLASAELYDPGTGTWAGTSDMSIAWGEAFTATVLADGRVLVAGGVGPDGSLASAEVYNPDLRPIPGSGLSSCGSATTVDRLWASDPACFGSGDVRVTGWLAPAWGIGDTSRGIDPAWLEPLVDEPVLWQKPRNCDSPVKADCEWLFLHVRPGSGVTLAAPERWVELTGHFSDPVAETCRWNGAGTEMTPSAVIELCRKQFVVTVVRDVPAP